MKRIVLIGAGYAGVLTAKRLAKKLKKQGDVEITLFNKESYHTMLTELHEVAAGRVDEQSIRLQLSDIFAHRKVNVIVEEVDKVNFIEKEIHTKSNETFSYDYLVIGTGCKPSYFDLKGSSNAYPLWSYVDAVRLNVHIQDMFRRACEEKDEEERKKLLSFVIVGSGFTGVEMAGELGEYKVDLCRKFDIDISEVSIQIVEMGDKILPFYPDKLVNKIQKRLEKLGVEVLTNQSVCSIDTKTCTLSTDKMLDTHTVIWTAGIEGSEFIDRLDDISVVNRGRIETNSKLESVDHEDVYVVGDNIYYIPEGSDRPVPQMVENAEHSSEVVAHNITTKIIEKGEQEDYTPVFQGSMVCIGGRWGAAYIGKKEKKTSLTGFPALFVKHFVNIIYFMEVLGLHKVWSYAKHEFFTVKNKRSLVGGHFSNEKSAPGFFLFPLRIFVGFMWLSSGLTKLPKLLDDWTNVFLMPRNPLDAAKAAESSSSTDAVSQATDAAAEVATDATSQATDVAEASTDAVTQATEAATEAVAETAEAVSEVTQSGFESAMETLEGITELKAGEGLPVPDFIENIMEKSYEWFFWSSEGGFTLFAQITQGSMIIMEIIIGIMLILGLLTPVAAIIGALLTVVIYLSGWSYISIIFFGTASLACIFAGNVLGLDYYLLPWIDKKLRKWKITRKWYLYFKYE